MFLKDALFRRNENDSTLLPEKLPAPLQIATKVPGDFHHQLLHAEDFQEAVDAFLHFHIAHASD